MEFRLTVPLTLGTFDIFHPNNITLNQLGTLIPCTNKIKTDEYIIIPNNSDYNIKMGDNGNTYDVKYKVNNDNDRANFRNVSCGEERLWSCISEQEAAIDIGDHRGFSTGATEGDLANEIWKGLAKGNLTESPGDITLFANKLIELETITTSQEDKDILIQVAKLLNNGIYERVFTRKHLCTMKSDFVVEQIDFSVWIASNPNAPRRMFRSISLEGNVPKTLLTNVQVLMNDRYKQNPQELMLGAFPKMLEQCIKLPSSNDHLYENVQT